MFTISRFVTNRLSICLLIQNKSVHILEQGEGQINKIPRKVTNFTLSQNLELSVFLVWQDMERQLPLLLVTSEAIYPKS